MLPHFLHRYCILLYRIAFLWDYTMLKFSSVFRVLNGRFISRVHRVRVRVPHQNSIISVLKITVSGMGRRTGRGELD